MHAKELGNQVLLLFVLWLTKLLAHLHKLSVYHSQPLINGGLVMHQESASVQAPDIT